MPAKKPRKPNKRSTNRKQPSPSVSGQAARKCESALWPIDQLHPHPRQDELFPPLPEKEFQAFVADIRRRKIQNPVDIILDNTAGLTPGTVLCGHQRLRAAQILQFTEIEVRIRHDLADKSAAEIEEVLIADNFVRRQLSRLQKAKLTLRLYELELERLPGLESIYDEQEARQRVAERIGRSDKTVERHLAILRTPAEVQQAFDEKGLKIELAVQVASLPLDVQSEIAARLRAGENAKSVVTPYLQRKSLRSGQATPLRIAEKLLRQFLESVPSDYDVIALKCPGLLANELLSELEQLDRVVTQLSPALIRAQNRVSAALGQRPS